jgi:tripartite-type tricarboxylate transporter receptor subunit TctC
VNELQKELGVTISIQYKPGAGGMIGASFVATQKPDGYTLISHTYSSLISATFLEKKSPYDPLKDFTPIVAYGVSPNILANHISSNLTSLDDVIKYAKEKPGALNCASPGIGTTAALILEVFKMYGINITHVPAKGGGPAATNLLGKHVDLGVMLYPAAIPHVKSGAFRLLATTDKIFKDVPTFTEKGFPECRSLGAGLSILAPSNLPKDIQDIIANSVKKVVQIPSVKKALEDAGYFVEYRGPDEFNKIFIEDYHTLEKIVKAAGLGKFSK